MFFIKNASLLLLLGLTSGCSFSGESVDSPTWVEDIRPIVQANCLRCHAPPSLGGAPTDFRLDVYEDTILVDGRVIRGAHAMARFIAIRAGEEGTMPPDYPRSDGQRTTFMNWWKEGAPLGNKANNIEPRARLVSELSQADISPVEVVYEVSDADGDLVSGHLRVGTQVVNEFLMSGRGTVTIEPSSFEEGEYPIVASMSDDVASLERTIGTLVVRHAGGNTAPTVRQSNSLTDALLSDRKFPLALTIALSDPDPEDTLSFDVTAFRGSDEFVIDEDVAATIGDNLYTWNDSSALPEGPGWRLRISATDGRATTITESGRFFISHQTSNLVFADVESLFEDACRACHPSAAIPGLSVPSFVPGGDPRDQIEELRGRIYRRVILEKNMPPPSAVVTAEQEGLEWRALSASELATLAEYLLGAGTD